MSMCLLLGLASPQAISPIQTPLLFIKGNYLYSVKNTDLLIYTTVFIVFLSPKLFFCRECRWHGNPKVNMIKTHAKKWVL